MKEIPAERLEPFTFFVDRSLGKQTVPDALRSIGLRVEAHADHFAHDAPDTEWLSRCGDEGWVVLAKDKAIKKNPLERQVLISHGIAAFFIIKTNATGEDNAKALVEAIPKIIGILENQRRPFIARIYASGDVELWVNHKNIDLLAQKQARRGANRKKS